MLESNIMKIVFYEFWIIKMYVYIFLALFDAVADGKKKISG